MMLQDTLTLSSSGYALELSPESFGELRDANDLLGNREALHDRFAEDGYLLMRGLLDRDAVLDARRSLTSQFAEKGGLDPAHPAMEAIVQQVRMIPALFRDVQVTPEMKAVLYEGAMIEFFTRFLGGEVRHFDFTWVRSVPPGPGTYPHCDFVYMGRGTHQLFTAWTPMGDVSLKLGGLLVLEKSHLQSERLRNYLSLDVDTYCANHPDADRDEELRKAFARGRLSNNPVTLREKLGGRWLTTEFRAGDVLIFGMNLVHASLDNQSNAMRFSTDTRYQLASEPVDERWVGENPIGHGQAGKHGRIC